MPIAPLAWASDISLVQQISWGRSPEPSAPRGSGTTLLRRHGYLEPSSCGRRGCGDPQDTRHPHARPGTAWCPAWDPRSAKEPQGLGGWGLTCTTLMSRPVSEDSCSLTCRAGLGEFL